MSRGFIYAEPSQKGGLDFSKEVLLGVLQDSLILKAALEAVHAAVQTESKNQKASALAAVNLAFEENPSLELDDLTPIAVGVFKCPESKKQTMLQILEDLHKPEKFGAILSQLRQLFEVIPQEEKVTSLPASCHRDESAWNSTASTTAAADRTGSPDDGRLTLAAAPAPKYESLIEWIRSNLTGTRPPEELRVDCAEASLFCREAWLCAELEKRFDRIRDGKVEWNEFEQIGLNFSDRAKTVIRRYLNGGSLYAFKGRRNVKNEICDPYPEVWESAARDWAVEEASALANKLVCGVDRVCGQVVPLNDKSGHATLRVTFKVLPHESEHVGLTAVIRKCFTDHVNKRIGLYPLELASENVEGFEGQKMRYDLFRESVHELSGIVLPNFYRCRRLFRGKLVVDWGYSSTPGEFDCNVDKSRLTKVVETYVKEIFGLEVAKAASRQLDKGWKPTAATTAAADRTGSPDDGRLTLPAAPAPKYERLIEWIRSNLTGTRPPEELRVDCAEASLYCREAWLCAELEKRFDKIRDGKVEWNEFEQIGLNFSDRAKSVIWRTLNGGSLYAFRGVRNVKNEFCNSNPELWESAARDWAVEEASALANRLVCGVDRVCGQVVPLNDKSGHATLRIKFKVLPHESEHVDLTAVIRKCFTDHVNKRIGLYRLDLAFENVEGFEGQKMRYDLLRESVHELSGIVLPNFYRCRRSFRGKLVVDWGYSSTPGEFDCNVDKSRLTEVVETYVKEIFGLEVAKAASRQLDRGTAVSVPPYCNNPAAAANYTDSPATCYRVMSGWKPTAATTAAADAIGRTNDGRLTTPAPKHQSLMKWICINLTGTRTQRELRSVFTDQGDSFCRDAWLCAELEQRFDQIRDGKAEWNELEDIGLSFTEQAKNVILKYLKKSSSNESRGAKNVDNEFYEFNPELWKSAAREWAVERASALAKTLYGGVNKVRGEVLPSPTTGSPTLVVKWNYSDQVGSRPGLAKVTRRCVNSLAQQMIDSKSDLYLQHLGGNRNELIHEDCDYKAFQKFLRENIGIVLPDSDDLDEAFRDIEGLDRVSPSPPHEFECNVDTDRLIEFAEDCIQRIFGLKGVKHAFREFDKSTAVSNPSCCNNPSAAAAESPGVPDDEFLTTAADPSKAVEANLRPQSSQRPSFYNNPSKSSRTAAADSTGPPDDGRWTLLQPTFAPNHNSLIGWICTNLTGTKTFGKLFSSSNYRAYQCREAWLCAELQKRFDLVRDGKAQWNEFEEIGFSFTDQAKNVILKYLKEGSSSTFQGGMNVDEFCNFNPELWKLAAHEWAVKEARVLASKLAGEVSSVSMFLTKTENPTLRVKLTYRPSNGPKHSSLTTFLRKCFLSYVNAGIDKLSLACKKVEEVDGQIVKLFEDFRNSVRVFSGIVIPQSDVCCRAFRDNLGVSLASSSPVDNIKCKVDKNRLITLVDAFLKHSFGFEGAKPASRQLDKDTAISNLSYSNSPSAAAAEALGMPDDKCLTNESSEVRSLSQELPQDEWTANKISTYESKADSLNHSKEVLERFIHFGELDRVPNETYSCGSDLSELQKLRPQRRTSSQRPSCYNDQSKRSRVVAMTAAADSTGSPDDGRWTPCQPTFAPNHKSLTDWICTNLTGTKTVEKLLSSKKFRAYHCREAWLCAELEQRFDRVRDGKAEWNEFEEIGLSFTDQAKNVILKYLKEGSSNKFQGGENVDKFCDFNPKLWELAAHEWAVNEARVIANELAGEVSEVALSLTKAHKPTLRVKLTYLPSKEPKHVDLIKFLKKCFVGYVDTRINEQYRLYRLKLACENAEEFEGQRVKDFEDFRNSVQVFSGIVIPQSAVCCRAFKNNLGVSLASPSPLDNFKCQVDEDRLIKLADALLKQYFDLQCAEHASRKKQ